MDIDYQTKNSDEAFGTFINDLSKTFPEVSFAKLSRICIRTRKWVEQYLQGKETVQGKEVTLPEFNFDDKLILESAMHYAYMRNESKEYQKVLWNLYSKVNDMIDHGGSKKSDWEPSDKQLGALATAIIDERVKGSDAADDLRELYWELKGLNHAK